MKLVEIFVALGAGYVSGLAISSGFFFLAIRKVNQSSWSSAKETAWTFGACINLFIGSLMPVFLFISFVFGNEPDSPLFWPKATLFTVGLLLGAVLVLFGVQQVTKGTHAMVGKDA